VTREARLPGAGGAGWLRGKGHGGHLSAIDSSWAQGDTLQKRNSPEWPSNRWMSRERGLSLGVLHQNIQEKEAEGARGDHLRVIDPQEFSRIYIATKAPGGKISNLGFFYCSSMKSGREGSSKDEQKTIGIGLTGTMVFCRSTRLGIVKEGSSGECRENQPGRRD